jgi:hypothetical protein
VLVSVKLQANVALPPVVVVVDVVVLVVVEVVVDGQAPV